MNVVLTVIIYTLFMAVYLLCGGLLWLIFAIGYFTYFELSERLSPVVLPSIGGAIQLLTEPTFGSISVVSWILRRLGAILT